MIIKEYSVKRAELEDWYWVKKMQEELSQDKEASQYVYGSEEQVKGYFLNCLTSPQTMAILLLFEKTTFVHDTLGSKVPHGDYPVGIMNVLLHSSPIPSQVGIGLFNTVFIHSVYIKPKVDYMAGKLFYQAAKDWGKDRGAKAIFGNIRPDGNLKGFERKYGLKPRHVVMMADIEE